MSKIIDERNLDYDRFPDGNEAEHFAEATERVAAEVEHELIAEPSKVNRFTGHLSELRSVGAPGFSGERDRGEVDYIAQAKAYATSVAEAVGFEAGEPAEFEADSTVTTTSGGLRVVSLQQTFNGIEVWSMSPKVWLHEGGEVDRLVGDTVSVPPDLPTKPAVPAEVALRVAAEEAAKSRTLRGNFGEDELPALDLSDSDFRRLSFQSRPDQPMTFDKGAFEEDIPARLVYLDMGGDLRLTWFFTLSREGMMVQYKAFVEADEKTPDKNAPRILYFYDATSRAVAITGSVIRHNLNEGGFNDSSFPLEATAYPVWDPASPVPNFPLPWTEAEDGKVATVGNNVRALNGKTKKPFEIAATNGGGVFQPAPNTPEQFVTNIFYFCNYMHDFFLLLGFTEESGNFQMRNVMGRGLGADPVHALAHPNPVPGTANMTTRADGLFALMNMGLVRSTGLHTANDADVVFHEYVHGVTNRLVGGMLDADGLNEDQSVAMGEGWGDFFALTIINFSREQERVVTGNWVINNAKGIRQRPYDAEYPGTFGDIGKGPGQVAGDAGLSYREVHDVGEIWCAALMQLTRNVAAALESKERGYQVVWQAVVDGLKLTPKNPSFLVARDAILRALKSMRGAKVQEGEYAKVRQAAWEAFAQFGMGFDAFCPNASFRGCQGGTAMPPDGVED